MRTTEPARTLTVLGCDGSYPSAGGAASGYLVTGEGTTLLLDAGPGTFANLQRFADPGVVDAVVLSHGHPDHWTDLESMAVWLRVAGVRRPGTGRPPLPVLAPPGLRRRSYFADDPNLHWHEVEPSARLRVGGLDLRFAATDHGPPTLAVRVDAADDTADDAPPPAAQALAYSADSGPDWTVDELGTGIGTVVCEATYTRESEGRLRHLSGRQAGAMAAAAAAGRLVVTHRWPTVSARALGDEAASSFGAAVEQAAVGAVFGW